MNIRRLHFSSNFNNFSCLNTKSGIYKGPNAMNIIRVQPQRYAHTVSKTMKIYCFPITETKSYLHFKDYPEFINNDSKIIKYENMISSKAASLWTNFCKSDKKINQTIVYYINKFLSQISWEEDSLKSIPSKSALLRIAYKKKTDTVSYLKATEQNTTEAELQDIEFLYPNSIIKSEKQILNEVKQMYQIGQQYHKKQILINLGLFPLTLPLIILPIVPNVPGFYLFYRAYSNFKALQGANHLKYLHEEDHLSLKPSEELNEIYVQYNKIIKSQDGNHKEQIFLNEETIEQISKQLDLPEIEQHLKKALAQETNRINSL